MSLALNNDPGPSLFIDVADRRVILQDCPQTSRCSRGAHVTVVISALALGIVGKIPFHEFARQLAGSNVPYANALTYGDTATIAGLIAWAAANEGSPSIDRNLVIPLNFFEAWRP